MSCHFSSSSTSTNGSSLTSCSCSCGSHHENCIQRISSLEKQLQYQETWIKVMGDWIQQKFGFDIQLIVGVNLDASHLYKDNKILNGQIQHYHHHNNNNNNNNNNSKHFKNNNNIQKLDNMDFSGRSTTTTATQTSTRDTIPIHTNLNNMSNSNNSNGFTKHPSLPIPPHFNNNTLYDSSSSSLSSSSYDFLASPSSQCSNSSSIHNNNHNDNNNRMDNNNHQVTISTRPNNIFNLHNISSSPNTNFLLNGSPSTSNKIKTIVTFGSKNKNNTNCSSSGGSDSKYFEPNNRERGTKRKKFENFEEQQSKMLNKKEEQGFNISVGHNSSNYSQAINGEHQDSSRNHHHHQQKKVHMSIAEFTAAGIPIKMEVGLMEEGLQQKDSRIVINSSNNNDSQNILSIKGIPENELNENGQEEEELEHPNQVNTHKMLKLQSDINDEMTREEEEEEFDEEGFQVVQIEEDIDDDVDDDEQHQDNDEEMEEGNQLETEISQYEGQNIHEAPRNPAFVKVVATRDGQLVQIIHENDPDIDIKYDPFNQLTFEAAETESQQQNGLEENIIVQNTINSNNSHQQQLAIVDSGEIIETEEEAEERRREEEEEEQERLRREQGEEYDEDEDLCIPPNHPYAFNQYYDESIEDDDEMDGRIGTVVVSAARLESRGIVEPNEANSSNNEEEEEDDDDEEAPELDLEEPHKLQTYMQQRSRSQQQQEQQQGGGEPQPSTSRSAYQNGALQPYQHHRRPQQMPNGNRRKAFVPSREPPVIRHQRLMPMNPYEKLVDRLKLSNLAVRSSRFDFLWILQMKYHQFETLPFNMFIKRDDVRFWFEYLPNKRNPKLSRYRCRICVKHFRYPDGSQCTRQGALESPHGQLKPTAEENRSVLTCHAKKKTHQIICEQLELENDPDAKCFELDADLKKQLVEALKRSDGPTTNKTNGIIIS